MPNETLLRLPEVCRRVGFKKSKIYNLIKEGRFPTPVSIGSNSKAWLESEVQAFIDGIIARSRSEPPA